MPRYSLRTLLIVCAALAVWLTLTFAGYWGWSEYTNLVMRQRLTPIPVPMPPMQ
jgi:hypothetical protein